MSFIVKGFDIPKDAIYFKLSFYDGNRENEYGVSGNLKPYIIQIPKGHGRLIDMDNSMTFHGLHKEYFEECKRKIFEAHGILETEE